MGYVRGLPCKHSPSKIGVATPATQTALQDKPTLRCDAVMRRQCLPFAAGLHCPHPPCRRIARTSATGHMLEMEMVRQAQQSVYSKGQLKIHTISMFERFGDWPLFPHISAKTYQDKRRILKCGVLVIQEAQAGADAYCPLLSIFHYHLHVHFVRKVAKMDLQFAKMCQMEK